MLLAKEQNQCLANVWAFNQNQLTETTLQFNYLKNTVSIPFQCLPKHPNTLQCFTTIKIISFLNLWTTSSSPLQQISCIYQCTIQIFPTSIRSLDEQINDYLVRVIELLVYFGKMQYCCGFMLCCFSVIGSLQLINAFIEKSVVLESLMAVSFANEAGIRLRLESLQFQQSCTCFIMINTMNDNFNEYFYGFQEIQGIDNDKSEQFHQLDHQNSSLFHSFQQLQHQSPNFHSYQDLQHKKQQPTNDISFTTIPPQSNNPQIYQQTDNRIIFESKVMRQYQNAYQGTKNDTMELGINYKTLLMGYFRELQLLNELNSIEITHIDQFQKRSPSFSSLIKFFQNRPENQGIRSRCLQLFGSSECIKRIMSSRCKMSTKLQMIKFIEKMRLNLLGEGKIVRWKDIIKRVTQ